MSITVIVNALLVLFGICKNAAPPYEDISSIKWQDILFLNPLPISKMIGSLQFFNDPIYFLSTFLIPILFGIQLARNNISLNQITFIIGCHVVALCFGCRFWGETIVPPNSVYLVELEMHGQFDAFLRTFLFSIWFSLLLAQKLKNLPFLNKRSLSLFLRKDREFHALAFGCWIGSCIIPLDWGRSWQLWPIPNIIFGSFTLLFYKLFL